MPSTPQTHVHVRTFTVDAPQLPHLRDKLFDAVLFMNDDDRLEVLDTESGKPTGFVVAASSEVLYQGQRLGSICYGDAPDESTVKFLFNGTPVNIGIPNRDVEVFLKADVAVFKHLVEHGHITL